MGTRSDCANPQPVGRPVTTSAISSGIRQAWLTTVLVFLGAIAMLGVLFWREAVDVYRVWGESTAYNHCFLVLPLVGYLIWVRRDVLATATPRPTFLPLALLPFLSVLWLAAVILSVHEAQQLIVLTMLEVLVLSLLGWGLFKRLMGPLLYLYFLVPSGMFLVPALQDVAAAMAVKGLQIAGVPVFSDGVFIEIPTGRFVVAEACAGLRFLIASIAFGVFFAILSYRSWFRRGIFIALSVAVPIVANGIRVFGIIYAAYLLDSATAAVADHVIYGWVFFSAILILLILIGRSFSDRPAAIDGKTAAPAALGFMAPSRTAAVGVLAVLCAGVGPAYAALLSTQIAANAVAHARPPTMAAPWIPVEAGPPKWAPVLYGADYTFDDAFTDGHLTVRRFVALYVVRGYTNNLVRGENRVADAASWTIAGMPAAVIDVSGRRERVNLSEIVSGDQRMLVVWFYALDDAVVADTLTAKLHQLRGLILGSPPVSATVVLAIDMPDRTVPPLAAVSNFLAAMQPMPSYLREISR